MKDLENLQPEEQVQILLDMLEDQQTEIEEKDKIIREQKTQVKELLDLNEKLNNENCVENVQALKSNLKQTKESLQSERKQHQAKIRDVQDKLEQALTDKEYAETHQKKIEVPVERSVLYEKCNKCDQTALQRSKSDYERAWKRLEGEFEKRTAVYESVFAGFVAYALFITVFMAIRTQSFANDIIKFFQTIWQGLMEASYGILYAGKQAATISVLISNTTASIIFYWVLLVGVIVILVAGIFSFIWNAVRWIGSTYKKYCWDGISVMVSIMSTAFIVFFGDMIKNLLSMNQVVLLLMLQVIYMIVRWYVKGCRENRGHY